jgi:dihydropteroate synthase
MSSPVLRFRRAEYDLSQRTLIMGVLNVTPDSFSDGGKFFERERALEHGLRLAREGADILDVGGESTRPGAAPLPEDEEIRRVVPVIERLSREIPIPISIDTRKSGVAERALEAGAEMINDVSALRYDERMAPLAARWNAPVVLMHMRGQPENMQADTRYGDLIGEILEFLRNRVSCAQAAGIRGDRIIVDPGIGFGKSLEQNHNLLILKHFHRLKALNRPLLVGTSRKAFIGRVLGLPPEEREDGTLATVAVAVRSGANIVRVHEVARTRRVVQVVDAILRSSPEDSGAELGGGERREVESVSGIPPEPRKTGEK